MEFKIKSLRLAVCAKLTASYWQNFPVKFASRQTQTLSRQVPRPLQVGLLPQGFVSFTEKLEPELDSDERDCSTTSPSLVSFFNSSTLFTKTGDGVELSLA